MKLRINYVIFNSQLDKLKDTSSSGLEHRLIENIQPESEKKVKLHKRELKSCEK